MISITQCPYFLFPAVSPRASCSGKGRAHARGLKMMATDGEPLTEHDVRERVSLCHENLADVRSLSLPGTYHEKITHLGNALKSFVHLKSLDLSRNALTSLEGLQHLTYLENLNLYFNCISTLSEVFRLHTLTALKNVDLRLNPVVKNESDYRLFVVHMLPNLRQLDDRFVRDSERKASLLHFTTNDAYKFKKPSVLPKETATGRSAHPRAVYIKGISKKCLLMDADDEAVLNFIAKHEWDPNKPSGVTGSCKRAPPVEFHDLNSIYKMEKNIGRHWRSSVSPRPCILMEKKLLQEQEPVPKDAVSENVNALDTRELDREYRIAQGVFGKGPEKKKINDRILLVDTVTKELPNDPNLKFQDEANKIITHVSFAPHPGPPGMKTGSNWKEPDQAKGKSHGVSQWENKVLCEGKSIEQLLDLVDKHWTGSKSLHNNEKFLCQAETILSALQKPVPTDQQKQPSSERQEINKLISEKKTLQMHIAAQEEQYNVKVNSLQSELDSAKGNMTILKQKIDKLLEERTAKKEHNSKLEQSIQSTKTPDIAHLQITKLETQNQQLRDENASLKQCLQNLHKMQELAELLQESHRTLVSTNEHLLKELEKTRLKHKAEVEQLNWNYNKLKKTVDTQLPLLPPPPAATTAFEPAAAGRAVPPPPPVPAPTPPSNVNKNGH
ncbi:centrosomal protein of 72 kDa [Varanus komodoensis]|uniref:centrosomal protein of 72 kDa n=1 Tax=Varanus komodoensis TaxID=61221 RepID=UPI001CF78313|nr:centrosomal protein of 72 kDa [Varanus komodoensis]